MTIAGGSTLRRVLTGRPIICVGREFGAVGKRLVNGGLRGRRCLVLQAIVRAASWSCATAARVTSGRRGGRLRVLLRRCDICSADLREYSVKLIHDMSFATVRVHVFSSKCRTRGY